MSDKIKWFVPVDIEKGKNDVGEEVYKISGRASTQKGKDNEGESLDISGFDVKSLTTINWNHKSKDNPSAYLGGIEKIEFKKEGNNNVMDFAGELYPEMDMTKGVVQLMKALKKRGKQLGVSVEGSVTERGSDDKTNPLYNVIKKAKLTALALTPNPVNANTWVTLEKSEKGWEYDEETEVLMKSFEDGTIMNEEETDDKTEKAFTVENNQDLMKEDIEGEKNKKELKKSLVYSKIFNYFYGIDISKAKSVFQLISKISEMEKSPITDEQLDKAFKILDLAKSETTDSVETGKENDDKDLNDNVEKAKVISKSLSGKSVEEVTEALTKKGYSEIVIKKALSTEGQSDNINKSEIVDLLKSQNDGLNNKFKALGDIFQAQKEQNEKLLEKLNKSEETITDLSKELGTLKEEIKEIGKVPNQPKSILNKSYVTSHLEGNENGDKTLTYNIKHNVDRKTLIARLTEESGLNKSDKSQPLLNPRLADIAQEIELTKSLEPQSLLFLSGMNIKVVAE